MKLGEIVSIYTERELTKNEDSYQGMIVGFYPVWKEGKERIPGAGMFVTESSCRRWLWENEEQIIREWTYKFEKVVFDV